MVVMDGSDTKFDYVSTMNQLQDNAALDTSGIIVIIKEKCIQCCVSEAPDDLNSTLTVHCIMLNIYLLFKVHTKQWLIPKQSSLWEHLKT